MLRSGDLSPLVLKRDQIKEDLHLKPNKQPKIYIINYKSGKNVRIEYDRTGRHVHKAIKVLQRTVFFFKVRK